MRAATSHVSRPSRLTAFARASAPSVALIIATAFASACAGGGSDNGKGIVEQPAVCTVSAVSITPSSASVFLGATAQLLATPTSQNCTPVPTASWTSSAPGVATVSTTGLVTAVAAGTTTITVTVGAASGTANITVSLAPVGSLTISPSSATLVTGGTTTLSVVARDAANNVLTGRVVTFTSSAPGVASVGNGGVVTAVSAGTATITATSEGVSATANITVTIPAVASVTASTPSTALNLGGTMQASAVVKDGSNNVLTGRTVTWISSRPAVATISGSGLITALSTGTVTFTATSEGVSGDVAVTVQLPVASISLSLISIQLIPTNTASPTVTMRAADNSILTGRPVAWSSSAPSVASVNSTTGVITAVAVGTATITATVDGVSANMSVKVNPTLESNRFGIVWANQPSAPLNETYIADAQTSQNAAGGINSITRVGVGNYLVVFGKMAKVGVSAFRETFIVSAYGSAGESCRLGSWGDVNVTDLQVRVQCFTIDGAPVNSVFDLALVGSNTLSGQYAFAWNSSGTTSVGTADQDYAFNTGGTTPSLTRLAAGGYAMTSGFSSITKTTAMVSSYIEGSTCAVDFWNITTGILNARCAATNSATATDSRLTMLFMEAGRTGKRWGFVWSSQESPTLNTPNSPDAAYRNQSNGLNTTVTHNSPGVYTVTMPGLGTTAFNGTVFVSPYVGGTGGATGTCQVTGWTSNGSDLIAGLKCWDLTTKAPTDTRFVLIALE